jgi:hypothetical protein
LRRAAVIIAPLLLSACAAGELSGDAGPDSSLQMTGRVVGGYEIRLYVPPSVTATWDQTTSRQRVDFSFRVLNVGTMDLQVNALEFRDSGGDGVWRFEPPDLTALCSIGQGDDGRLIVAGGEDWSCTVGIDIAANRSDQTPAALVLRLGVGSSQGGTTLSSWVVLGETRIDRESGWSDSNPG